MRDPFAAASIGAKVRQRPDDRVLIFEGDSIDRSDAANEGRPIGNEYWGIVERLAQLSTWESASFARRVSSAKLGGKQRRISHRR